MEIGNAPKTGPKTEIGKFRSSLNAVRGNKSNKAADIPKDIREIYEFFKPFNTKEINQLKELKNLGQALKVLSLPSLIQRLKHGEVPNKREMELLSLLERTLVDSHKLEFGDKRVIEHNVTVSDIRRQMMSDKKIIDAEVISDGFRQDSDGSGKNALGQGQHDKEDLVGIEKAEGQDDSQHSESPVH